jgi:hypothetical protein|tara:strand:+ start:677 stop:1360 length:684 start_codon:yes stop_codon:yes gene_type:complete
MKNYFLIFLFFITLNEIHGSSFSLDKYEIDIESNFLGEEIVIFGEKSPEHNLIIILEGGGKTVRLNEKIKKKILWINKSTKYESIPNFFAIFSLPKKSLNELFLITKIKKNHYLISDSSQKLFKLRKALEQKSLYFEKPLIETGENLFFSRFKIPDNINSGLINIYFYKILDNKVISLTKKTLRIKKRGFIQKIELLLYNNSIFYVLILVLFAILFSLISNYTLRKR